MNCPECRKWFEPRRSDQGFCSTACNKASNARALTRSRRVYAALYHWRLSRKSKDIGANLRFICNEVAAWIREDRERQRQPPPPHDHTSDRGHQRQRWTPPPPVIRKPKA